MKSLPKCLDEHGFTKAEKAYFMGIRKSLIDQGYSNDEAGTTAIENHIASLRSERSSILDQIEKATGITFPKEIPTTITEPLPAVEAPPVAVIPEAKKPIEVSENKIFTEDAYEKAKREMRDVLSQMNAGADPRLLIHGVTIAGYHIEKGARTFAAYTKAMVQDLGEKIKPYLKMLYNAVRDHPDASPLVEEMDSYESVKKADIEQILTGKKPERKPAKIKETLKIGDTFEFNGRKYQIDLADDSGVRAMDLTGAYPISRKWLSIKEFEKETGKYIAEPDIIPIEEVTVNDNSGNGGTSPGALAGQLPGNVQPYGEERGPAEGERGRGEANVPGNAIAPAGGEIGATGVGGVPGPVHPVGSEPGLQSVENPAPISNPRPLNRSGVNPGNYQITEADIIGKGTRGTRIDNNLAAIRLIKQLDKEHRYPTTEEQSILAKYVGWGGLKNVFDESSDKPQDQKAFKELKSLLTEAEFFEARQSIQDAHYTERNVIDSMFNVLQFFGVKGGHFLEPTYGVGLFPGLMPQEMADSSKWYGSEMDIISAKIGQYLFPRSQFLNLPFQEAEFPYSKFDVAIGNPPFGDWRITDTNKKRAEINGMKIHNYVIAKSAMHIKPGGVMSFVVTSRFLDSADPEVRDYLGKHLKFLAAIRLPNTTFKENAGTEVTTDIVFFQKPMPEETYTDLLKDHQEKGWFDNAATMTNERGEEVTLNKYFVKHPEMMLGIPSMAGTMYGRGEGKKEFTLEPKPGISIKPAINNLLEGETMRPLKDIANQDAKDLADALAMSIEMNKEGVGIGGYFMEGNNIYTRIDDDAKGNPQYEKLTPDTQWTPKAKLGQTRYDRIKSMLGLREKAYELIRAERFDMPEIEDLRKELNKMYDKFVSKYGFISDTANSSLMSEDMKIESGLETNYKKAITPTKAKTLGVAPSPSTVDKSTIMKERVYYPKKEILHADSVRDGYGISLSEKGKLDIPYISSLTNKTQDEVIQELSDASLIFKDPSTGVWVQEDEYLSGNVKEKLKQAQDAEMTKNVKALEAVQPKDVPTEDIFVDMGATWIPRDTYRDFAQALGITGARVSVIPETGRVTITDYSDIMENELSIPLKNSDYTIDKVFNAVANHQALIAYDKEDDKRVVNRERTKALIPIGKKIAQTFRDWIFADPMRATELTTIYNDTQNTHAERKFAGQHLKTYGSNPAIQLYDTQKRAAWRMIQSPVVLLDHVVGSGKTMTIATGVNERNRMAISRKALIVVPNHIVGQWAREYIGLYPGANILAASEKDFSAPNRKRLLARMATGKYDAMIIGHSSLSFIPMEKETQAEFIREEMAHLEKALHDAQKAEDKRAIKSLANRIEKKREKIKRLMDMPKSDVATWESMGIDYIVVDESQEFKNLEYSTFMQSMAGMGTPTGSLKAFDLYAKVRYTRQREGGITFATGTPISNSLVEMYSLLRYLNKEELDKRGLGAFDAWAKAYAGIENRIEYTATQKLKDRLVMTSFNNLPELKQLYLQFADVVSREDLKRIYTEQMNEWNKNHPDDKRITDFPEPKVKGGQRQLNVADSTPAQKEFMDYLVARADILEKNKDPEYKKIDNHLWLMNDARKMALDVRLVDPKADPGTDTKIDRTAANVKRLYDAWSADKGTQLVFCDLSTPLAVAEKTANTFINSALKMAGLEKDRMTKYRLERMTGAEKWDYIRHQILSQIERLSASIDEVDLKKKDTLEEYLAGISDEDAAALTTLDTKFSVYDELKAKLINMGIPEGEVKFIHEANTKDRKEELFGLVNAGQVRILIGSSKKMGAGTNVQERLVGLHHMDAPWRPSDVEQREGRIIRQGNALYERDPKGFEVEIVAYSTRNTFDSVMWQILARKAEMIESLKSNERSVKDQTMDSASYADFMAESTGNPVFKEKFRLEGQIEELESTERRIAARRAASEGTVKNADELIVKAETRLADRQDAVKKAAAADSYEYEGKTYKDDLATGMEAAKEEWSKESAKYDEELPIWEKWELGKADAKAKGAEAFTKFVAENPQPKKPKIPLGPDALSRLKNHSEVAKMIYKIKEYLDEARNGSEVRINFGEIPIKFQKEESWMTGDSKFITFLNGMDIQTSHGKEISFQQLLRGLSGASIRNNLNISFRDAEYGLHETKKSIEAAKLTLEKVKFEEAEKLKTMKDRYKAVVDEVSAIESKVAQERETKRNKYIDKDTNRFYHDRGGTVLYSIPFVNPEVILNSLRLIGKDIKAAMPHLVDLGRQVIRMGARTYESFARGMRQMLGSMWDGFKSVMIKVFSEAKKQPRNLESKPLNTASFQEMKKIDERIISSSNLNPAHIEDTERANLKLFELVSSNIPPKMKAELARVFSTPWFGSEGNVSRRAVVLKNVERSHNRNEIRYNIYHRDAESAYLGIEGMKNALATLTHEDAKIVDRLIKEGDISGEEYTTERLLSSDNPIGRPVSKEIATAYRAFRQVIFKAGEIRFTRLRELAILPYKNRPWYDSLRDLALAKVADRPEIMAKIKEKDKPAVEKALGRAEQYWTDLEKIKKEWGMVKGYAPRTRQDGEYFVNTYRKFNDWDFALNKEGTEALLDFNLRPEQVQQIREIAAKHNAKVIADRSGTVVITRADGVGPVVDEIEGEMAVNDEEPLLRKVYMQTARTSAGALRHKAEVESDLPKYLKSNYDKGGQYITMTERNTATPAELANFKGTDLAMEAMIDNAFEQAAEAGALSEEQIDSLKQAVIESLAKESMARGFGRHGITRAAHLIEGYKDKNYLEVATDFVSGLAGWLSKMQFAIEASNVMRDIPKNKPEDKAWVHTYVRDAMKNATYLDQMAASARSVASIYYMALKFSTVLLNAFQNITVAQAEFSKHTSNPMMKILAAQKDVMRDYASQKSSGKRTLSKEEVEVLDKATREGIDQAQAIEFMSGLSETGASSVISKATRLGMTAFQWVETHLNREPAMLAAYRVFKTTEPGKFDQAAFDKAEAFVYNTHYLMGKENLPELARGPLGKTLYVFQGYVHNYLHWMFNRFKQGEWEVIARSIGALVALGGVAAIPILGDLDKWIEKWFGVSYSMKFHKFMRDNTRGMGWFGDTLTDFVNHGLPSVAGVDMSRAIAVNMPIVSDPERTLAERLGGAWGTLLTKPTLAAKAMGAGDTTRAIENLLPEFIANPMRAMRQVKGATTLAGKPILDEHGRQIKYTGPDVAKKILGFQPIRASERLEAQRSGIALTATWNQKRNDAIAKLRNADTPAEISEARRNIIKFNMDLRKSQAVGLVNIITAETINRSIGQKLSTKAEMRKQRWMQEYVET